MINIFDKINCFLIRRRLKINPNELEQISGACPSQWIGVTDDGHQIYIRFRHDHLTVSVSKLPSNNNDDAVYGIESLLILNIHDATGQTENGCMTTTELNQILHKHKLSSDPDYKEDTTWYNKPHQFTEGVLEIEVEKPKKK